MSDRLPEHGAVVLAAGASARLGRPKQLLLHRGETLVRRAARLALETQPREAAIVLGFDAERVSAQVEDLPIRRIPCALWRHGLGASLRAGVDALAPECDGALIVLCDQPELDAAHLLSLRDAWRRAPERGAASFYAGRLGVPALLPRAAFAALDAESDRGMRELLRRHADRIQAIANEALAFDVDRPEDARRLSRRAKQNATKGTFE